MTLYRKYRPQKLEDLDSMPVREKLEKILSSSFRPHAFIFSGPKGTGKTSAARITAKILNCENKKGDSIDPCNKCSTCISIQDGNFLDVLEIDAASNRGIEEIRELRDKIKFAPVSGKFKVYIIDEVHMLTNEAFNALLKTLEEPPSHAVFILATTEADKLPTTIMSRCLVVEFKKAGVEEIVRSLRRVVEGEKLKLDDEFLKNIAYNSEGSFRDATKILEQMASENALDVVSMQKALGRDGTDNSIFLDYMKKKDLGRLLQFINSMGLRGANIRIFVASLLSILHSLLLKNNGIDNGNDEGKFPDFTNREIISMINVFSGVYLQLKNVPDPVLPLLTAAVEWCEVNNGNQKSEIRNK